ncbi:MAG: acyltransferase [Bryobacterales bacterium]|nr:acyltransferase [Bryobacterales bacterium]
MQIGGQSPNLDFLRTIAVLLVLLDHVTATVGIAQRHPWLFTCGYWGVLLFFVHTSLVLMMSLDRLPAEGTRRAAAFYLRRFFRIYPLSTVVITLVLLVGIPETSWEKQFQMPTKLAIAFNYLLCGNLTYTQPVLGPLWSLPFEVEMYLVLPFLFTFFCRNSSFRRLAAVWVGSVVLALVQRYLSTKTGLGIERLNVASYGPCFVAGAACYFLALRAVPRKTSVSLWPSTVLIVSAGYLLLIRSEPGELTRAAAGWIGCLVIGVAVAHMAELSNSTVKTIAHCVAKYSYGLYLCQVPVLWLVFTKWKGLSPFLQWPLFLVLIVFIPVACFHLVEDPFIEIGRKFTRVLPQRRLTPCETVAGEAAEGSLR